MKYEDKNVTPLHYDVYWETMGEFTDGRNEEIFDLCPKGLKSIDLGGGRGILAKQLNATLVDWSPVAIKQAKDNGVDGICKELIPFLKECEEKYELVVLADVLEEMKMSETQDLLDGIKKICNKYFVISTPTHENYLALSTHQVIYDKNELKKMIEDRGFKLEEELKYSDRLIARYSL